MPQTRRRFLQYSGLAGAAALLSGASRPQLDPSSLAKFVDPLPLPPVIRGGSLRIEMREMRRKLHRDLPATRLWTYGNSFPGPTIETRTGQALSVDWVNNLPTAHFLPIDHNLHGAEAGTPDVRAVVHVHGAKAPPESDGYPEDWYVPGKSRTYRYPNNQDAAALWYHDHAMGINRLNIYAGLIGLYIVRDDVEDALNLPGGRYEVPLVICDRFLTKDGQLDYPVSGTPGAPWVPEVFGNAFLVNGTLFPYLDVEPRKYRLRVLNASNGRFYRLSFEGDLQFHQVGTDQGLLAEPVPLKKVLIAPGERADLVFDFSTVAGERVVLHDETVQIMQFRVARSGAKDTSLLPSTLRAVPKFTESPAVRTRDLPIYEMKTPAGDSAMMLLNGMHWDMPVTEDPVIDTVEIWNIINLTDDVHPIHLHLVRFQILDRRPFDDFEFTTEKRMRYVGPAILPEANEAGWKDTVRANPKMVTRIIARFEGYKGRYVWHCHVLEHEDNEMMRPYEVIAAT